MITVSWCIIDSYKFAEVTVLSDLMSFVAVGLDSYNDDDDDDDDDNVNDGYDDDCSDGNDQVCPVPPVVYKMIEEYISVLSYYIWVNRYS